MLQHQNNSPRQIWRKKNRITKQALKYKAFGPRKHDHPKKILRDEPYKQGAGTVNYIHTLLMMIIKNTR
jgi:hypothetical protein